MNSTETIQRQSQKYVEASLILEGQYALNEMTVDQVYALMEDDFYIWNETLACWFSIF